LGSIAGGTGVGRFIAASRLFRVQGSGLRFAAVLGSSFLVRVLRSGSGFGDAFGVRTDNRRGSVAKTRAAKLLVAN
jgi:hypothetical protein